MVIAQTCITKQYSPHERILNKTSNSCRNITQTRLEKSPICLDCDIISNHEIYKSTISSVSPNEDVFNITSPDSSCIKNCESELNWLSADEETPYLDIPSGNLQKSYQRYTKRFSNNIPFVLMPNKGAHFVDCRSHNRHSPRTSSSRDEVSERGSYYNDPQIDILDIFKPQKFGKHFFKTKTPTLKQTISYENNEHLEESRGDGLTARILLSTEGMAQSPKESEYNCDFASQYIEDISSGFYNFDSLTYCDLPKQSELKHDLKQTLLSFEIENEIMSRNLGTMKTSNTISLCRLVKCLDVLSKREKNILWRNLSGDCSTDGRYNTNLGINPIKGSQKRAAIDIIDKVLRIYACVNDSVRKIKRRKRRPYNRTTRQKICREMFFKQQYSNKISLPSKNNSFSREKKTKNQNIKVQTEFAIACHKKNLNSNSISTQNFRIKSREPCNKSLEIKECPSKKPVDAKKSPDDKHVPKKVSTDNLIGNRCNAAVRKISPKSCSQMNQKSTPSELFKTVRESIHGQFITARNQPNSATTKQTPFVPPQPIVPSGEKKSITQKSNETFASTIQSFRDKIKAVDTNSKISPFQANNIKVPDTINEIGIQMKIDNNKKSTYKDISEALKNIKAGASTTSAQNNTRLDIHQDTNTEHEKTTVHRENSCRKEIQSCSKTYSKIDKASLFGKERNFPEMKWKSTLRGKCDIQLLNKDQNMNKEERKVNSKMKNKHNFKSGRQLHAELDQLLDAQPTVAVGVPARVISSAMAKVVEIPRLNLVSSSRPEGISGTESTIPRLRIESSKLIEERTRLQSESKSLYKEVQDTFYNSHKLQQESRDIVKSVRYGEYKSPQKSPIHFNKGELDSGFDLKINEHLPSFLQERVPSQSSVKPTNTNCVKLCNASKCVDDRDTSNYLEKNSMTSSQADNTFQKCVKTDVLGNKDICTNESYLKSTRLIPPSEIHIGTNGYKNPINHITSMNNEPSLMATKCVQTLTTISQLEEKTNMRNCEQKSTCTHNHANPNNRKMISYTYHSNMNLGMSLPEIVSYKPEAILKRKVTDTKKELNSTNDAYNKCNNKTDKYFTLQRGGIMSKTETLKSTDLKTLQMTKPRIWSSIQRRKRALDVTDSDHFSESNVTPSDNCHKNDHSNSFVLPLDATKRAQVADRSLARTMNLHLRRDSCTQTIQQNQRSDEPKGVWKPSKDDRHIYIQRNECSDSKTFDRPGINRTKSCQRKKSSRTAAQQQTSNDLKSKTQNVHHTLYRRVHDTCSKVTTDQERSKYDSHPPKIYLESAVASSPSNVKVSIIKRDASVLSSSIGSLSSSQFYEFIYPLDTKKHKKKNDVKQQTSDFKNATYDMTKVHTNFDNSKGTIHRNKTPPQPKLKLRSDRRADPIDTNERIWGWINGSDDTPGQLEEKHYKPRRTGHYDESGHAHEYNSNEQYPQRMESIGNISVQPYRRSSSLPSKLVTRTKVMRQKENDYDHTVPSHSPTGNKSESDRDDYRIINNREIHSSPHGSFTSISAKAYIKKCQKDNPSKRKRNLQFREHKFYTDVNHAHSPSVAKSDVSDFRLSEFENTVQNQISNRSDTFDTHTESFKSRTNQHSLEKEGQDRLNSLEMAYEADCCRICDRLSRRANSYSIYNPCRSYCDLVQTCCNRRCDPATICCKKPCDLAKTCCHRPCDLSKICLGEKKMYAWPPMFVGTRHRHCQDLMEAEGCGLGSHSSKDDRLKAMYNCQQHRLRPEDIKCNPCETQCKNNYVIKRFSGISDCGDVAKDARDDYLRNMRLVVKGIGTVGAKESFVELSAPTTDGHGYHDNQTSFNVSLMHSPPRHIY